MLSKHRLLFSISCTFLLIRVKNEVTRHFLENKTLVLINCYPRCIYASFNQAATRMIKMLKCSFTVFIPPITKTICNQILKCQHPTFIRDVLTFSLFNNDLFPSHRCHQINKMLHPTGCANIQFCDSRLPPKLMK